MWMIAASPASFGPTRRSRLRGFDGTTGCTTGFAVAGCCDLTQCNPTATACSQMIPRSRAVRHLQRLSTLTASLMISPVLNVLVPDCTTPLSNGGSHDEFSTRPCATKLRATFTISQPAISAKKMSFNATSAMRAECAAASPPAQLKRLRACQPRPSLSQPGAFVVKRILETAGVAAALLLAPRLAGAIEDFQYRSRADLRWVETDHWLVNTWGEVRFTGDAGRFTNWRV